MKELKGVLKNFENSPLRAKPVKLFTFCLNCGPFILS